MGKTVRIIASPVEVTAELNNSKTAQAIWDALPITGEANLWGDEIYFSIPVSCKIENGKEIVNIGDLGYWPPGSAFCIFFGPTPMSRGKEIRPASAVNVFGKVTGDPALFKQVASDAKVTIKRNNEQ